ncbi:carbohydrate ABC transporter permease [Pyrococcus abyssi]|uniref:Sugar transport binding protein dependent protein (Inner membrane) (MALFG subfamily) n=1 Tax=Pyrococcus abyssi (strain GE5 / Orsay) TaxID=272844 RepID=Q9V285_PYRAB|nr:carbohydrate ABC transporter permease [Pyrococcus abyssi]CAB49113.1 Sugar transport binding protein dependent protein (inner membrane) (MALFG subfamily) [Pyrococcus abyssi GE5]CCE69565.1 TPA: transmembrane sugar transport protein [Pyrococcus abyssi GE5]
MRDVETKQRRGELVLILAIFLATLPLIIGFGLLMLSSFSTNMITNFDFSQFHLTLENWINVFQGKLAITGGVRVNMARIILNTLIVALGVSGLVTLISVMSGYALSRMDFKGRKILIVSLMLLHAFPGVALIVGVYLLYRISFSQEPSLVRLYSFIYVIFARAALEVPMSVWLMKGFFDTVPWEFEWSGIIDGASRITVWRKIMLPLIKPGILAVALFSFLAGWQDIIYVRTFLIDQTLATFIEANIEAEYTHMPMIAAAGTLYLLPTIIFFLTAQQLLLRGYSGGIKG